MKRLLLVAFLLVPLTDLEAQEVSSIEPGADVRIKAEGIRYRGDLSTGTHWIRGSAISLDADSLVLEPPFGGTLVIPFSALTKLEVRSTAGRTAQKGAVIGGVVGVVSMFVLASAAYDDLGCGRDGGGFGFGPPDSAITISCSGRGTAMIIGAGLGAGVGALIGGRPRWEPVSLPLSVGFSPHGVRVALRHEFGNGS